MENKVDKIKKRKDIVLFPHYFKAIGFITIVLVLLTGIIIKVTQPGISVSDRSSIGFHLYNIMLMALFVIAWAKEKVEDEMALSSLKSSEHCFYFWSFSGDTNSVC